MASLSEAKTLGGVGSILILLGFVPFLGIVGWILVLIAVKYIADTVGDQSVWDNMLYAVILAIIGIAAISLLIFLPFLFGFSLFPVDAVGFDPLALFVLVPFLVGLVVGWIFALLSAIFLKRSFDSIAGHLSVPMFGTAAMLYLIGTILIIVVVGLFILFIAAILMIVAFFSIREEAPRPTAVAPPPAP